MNEDTDLTFLSYPNIQPIYIPVHALLSDASLQIVEAMCGGNAIWVDVTTLCCTFYYLEIALLPSP